MARAAPPVPGSLILTLGLDRESEAALDALRRAAWPGANPGVPAHLSLLRQLPGPQLPVIRSELATEARGRMPFPIRFLAPRAHGDALFLPARGEELSDLHAALVHRLHPMLRLQDRERPDLHVTLAAGLAPRAARNRAAALAESGLPARASAEALLLWQLLPRPGAEAAPKRPMAWSLLVRLRLGR